MHALETRPHRWRHTVRDRSECHIFDAARLTDGPIARIALPARICAGTHACWAPVEALRAPT